MSKSKNIDTNTKLTREDMLTADVAAEKLQQLRELFPGAFGESVNDEGDTVPSVDWERIRAEIGLGIDAFFNRRERYGLDWPGKTECVKLIQQPSLATLMPCPEESVDFDTTENLFIEGDNLEVLKLLQKSYFGKVKMIYIDPPYNTGHDFVYPDNFAEPLENYLELTGQKDALGRKLSANAETAGRFHTNWLNMMFPRLYLARNLLREDGVIFISIDDNEVANLKHLCNEVFGEENLIGLIVNVSNPKGRSDDKFLASSHEYILVAARNINHTHWKGFLPGEHITRRYNKTDENGNLYREIDLRKTGDGDRREDRPEMFYYFYYSQTTKRTRISKTKDSCSHDEVEIAPLKENGTDGRWRWGFDNAKSDLTRLIVRFMPNRNIWGIFEKDYLEGRSLVKPTTSWTFKEINSERGSEQFIELGFEKEVFPKPKPLGTLYRIFDIGTSTDTNDIILDFFSGSATTAHAVLEMNKEDGGNRRFIMVQIPEPCNENSEAFKAGYKTIADIGKERIRRVIKKTKDEKTENGKSLLDGDEKPQDLGFRVFKLDRSNFRVWDGSPGTTAEQLFERMAAMTDPLRDGTKPEDLLYELLLKAGFPLSTRVKKIKLAGKTVYSVEDDAVLLCLENEVTKALIDEVIKLDPVRFYCLDKAFKKNDQLKVNTIQQFAAHNQGRDKETEIVFRTI